MDDLTGAFEWGGDPPLPLTRGPWSARSREVEAPSGRPSPRATARPPRIKLHTTVAVQFRPCIERRDKVIRIDIGNRVHMHLRPGQNDVGGERCQELRVCPARPRPLLEGHRGTSTGSPSNTPLASRQHGVLRRSDAWLLPPVECSISLEAPLGAGVRTVPNREAPWQPACAVGPGARRQGGIAAFSRG
jgi:hypothetical protein